MLGKDGHGGCGACWVTMAVAPQERRDISRNMKYVELLLVADHAEVRGHPYTP